MISLHESHLIHRPSAIWTVLALPSDPSVLRLNQGNYSSWVGRPPPDPPRRIRVGRSPPHPPRPPPVGASPPTPPRPHPRRATPPSPPRRHPRRAILPRPPRPHPRRAILPRPPGALPQRRLQLGHEALDVGGECRRARALLDEPPQ